MHVFRVLLEVFMIHHEATEASPASPFEDLLLAFVESICKSTAADCGGPRGEAVRTFAKEKFRSTVNSQPKEEVL